MIVNPSFGGGEDCKLPVGGAAGQVLTKKSAADNDTEWKDVPKPDGVPTGTVMSYLGKTAPDGWVMCNGAILPISNYPNLAAFIEAQFGSKNHFGGNGTTTFAVPDLRDRFIVGAGNSYGVGATGGSAQVTLTVNQMPQHNHSAGFGPTDPSLSTGIGGISFSGAAKVSAETGYSGFGQPHENRPPYYALCFIMKQ